MSNKEENSPGQIRTAVYASKGHRKVFAGFTKTKIDHWTTGL